MRCRLKGFFFSLDALVAVGILTAVFIAVLNVQPSTISETVEYEKMHLLSEDAMQVFANTKFSSLDNETQQYYLNNTNISDEDIDKPLLDIVGLLWAFNETEYARNLTDDFFKKIELQDMGINYALKITESAESSTSRYICPQTPPEPAQMSYLTSANRLISGYKENVPALGFVARAWATRFRKNNTLIVMGDVISSSVSKPPGGNNLNHVNISYIIDLPEDANITEAYWFIEAAWTDNHFKAYINGEYIPGSDGKGKILLTNLKDYFHSGHNLANVVYRFGAGGYTGGDDGATHIVINYNTSRLSTLGESQRKYFQDVSSNCSIEYKKPVFVLGDINSMKVRLNLTNGTQVSNVTLKFMWNGNVTYIGQKPPADGIVEWDDSEIMAGVNLAGLDYSELGGRYFWFIVEVDEFSMREDIDHWRKIIGEDSYVEVDSSGMEYIYNYIDITKSISNYTYSDEDPQVDDFYRHAEWGFHLSNSSMPVMAKWQLAWLYWSGWDPEQVIHANDILMYNHSPENSSSDPLTVELARFGYDTKPSGVLKAGSNKFEMDFSNGYSINPFNSLGKYTVLIPSAVGYGETFTTEENASNDAIARLEDVLGEYVSSEEIVIDTPMTTGKIPWMWGPSIVTLEVWK